MFDTAAQREIGPYTVHELIGWSGISRVYRATDTSCEETEVAIKILRDSIISDVKYERRFMWEIEIACRLYHPNILAACGFGREQGVLFMVMPLVNGGTLADVVRLRRPLSPRHTLIIAEQIGSALDYVHSLQLVHCDIKPANILLCDENNYMLTDFGLAMCVDKPVDETSGEVMGTLMYMSPEQVRGDALDHRSDLYSMGLVLYECLTGRLPYDPRSLMKSKGHHVTAPPITPRQISHHFPTCLEGPLLRGVEKDQTLRFQSGCEMADALSEAIDELDPEDANHPLILLEEIEESMHRTQQSTIYATVSVMTGTEDVVG